MKSNMKIQEIGNARRRGQPQFPYNRSVAVKCSFRLARGPSSALECPPWPLGSGAGRALEHCSGKGPHSCSSIPIGTRRGRRFARRLPGKTQLGVASRYRTAHRGEPSAPSQKVRPSQGSPIWIERRSCLASSGWALPRQAPGAVLSQRPLTWHSPSWAGLIKI